MSTPFRNDPFFEKDPNSISAWWYVVVIMAAILFAALVGAMSGHAQSTKPGGATPAVLSVTDQGPMTAEQFQLFVAACKEWLADLASLNAQDATNSARLTKENDAYLRKTQEQRDRIVGKQTRLAKQATADDKWTWDMNALTFRAAPVKTAPAAPPTPAAATPPTSLDK